MRKQRKTESAPKMLVFFEMPVSVGVTLLARSLDVGYSTVKLIISKTLLVKLLTFIDFCVFSVF